MTTLQIGSSTFDVYADLADANEYAIAAFHATAWLVATDDKKKQALVTATRILDRQKWQGSKTGGSAQLPAWPRSGITSPPIPSDSVVPDQVIEATIELAIALVNGSTVQDDQSTANKIRSAGAGSANVSFFRGAEGEPLRFPLIVWELIGQWLGGVGSIGGFESFDTCTPATDNNFGIN